MQQRPARATTRPALPPAREALLALEESAMPDALTRFIPLDVHKAYVVIGSVDACAGYLRHMLSIRNAAASFCPDISLPMRFGSA